MPGGQERLFLAGEVRGILRTKLNVKQLGRPLGNSGDPAGGPRVVAPALGLPGGERFVGPSQGGGPTYAQECLILAHTEQGGQDLGLVTPPNSVLPGGARVSLGLRELQSLRVPFLSLQS